jgi:hypothetical protein
MAKRSAARAPIIIRQPAAKAPIIRVAGPRAPSRGRRAARALGHYARRAGHKALEEKHTFAAVGAGLALGFVEREKIALPSIPKLGMSGTYGIGLWLAGRYMRSRTMSHMATGLLSIAAYQLGKTGEIAGDVEGDGRFPL